MRYQSSRSPPQATGGLKGEKVVMDINYSRLLKHLEKTDAGAKLAKISMQTKTEKFILAEMVYASCSEYKEYEFWLEEPPRMDMTIRYWEDENKEHPGVLFEWLEAKMCYSDCVTRKETARARADEYAKKIKSDFDRQEEVKFKLADRDRNAILTSALFVIHFEELPLRHPYYPRGRTLVRKGFNSEKQILSVARKYCSNDILCKAECTITQKVEIRLDDSTRLLGFFYRRP